MHKTNLKWCIWSGVPFLALWLIGFVVADVIPPPSPDADAESVAAFYAENRDGIRVGFMLTIWAAPLYVVWATAIAVQMKRMRGAPPWLGDLQLLLGGLTVLVFVIPALLIEVAAFRTGRDAEIVQVLSDIAWLQFIGAATVAILQPLIVGIAILSSDGSLIPRWCGYFNIWVTILFAPGPFCVFFQTGPLAWDGLLPWWIPLVVFAVWMVVMMVVIHRSLDRTEQTDAPARLEDPALAAYVDRLVDEKVAKLLGRAGAGSLDGTLSTGPAWSRRR